MKTIQLQFTLLSGTLLLLLIGCLLVPLLIILGIFLPYFLKNLIFKLVTALHLINWLQEIPYVEDDNV